ncbi:3-hydroxyacyl-CoA dehydrogenase NAD-binding domain-containing protein [Sulfurimonas sp.]|jgi:3-hydroxyacyl-CoA dehydrogenase / enoyl-CoA hydratase / 3-hydroxybutyryl-CoA epimerase|uniref:3-hydroxyacyl-CoA dehydrogenase NAD-binding domain-containing protein n=1 Tax=Sulfurimonas sp. TaxID=2022749 RepID=UPI0025EBA8A3|nr:3-hydroxyacyl-CoA dehydrogenase NAD-binding domain-containing protein [Sulfurimonas sp.]MBT5933915.1 fatty-acid oxidation protein subunit alpha [Sulfurimonas sp.]
MNAFNLQVENKIATLMFDMPDSNVNILSISVMRELETILDELKNSKDIDVLLFKSAKKDIFIAGADISEIKALSDEQVAYEVVRKGQTILSKIRILPFHTIAVIDGACLGGGFELALKCDYRITTENPSTKIGLPEVNLGVLPGFGGTQSLKNLIGKQKSLELILGSKLINGQKAQKLKMVDSCVPVGYLDFKLQSLIKSIMNPSEKEKIDARRYKSNLIERFAPSIIYSIAQKTVMKKTKGKYPAALEVIKLFRETDKLPVNEALSLEAYAFARLCVTDVSKNLISLFYASEQLKHDSFVSKDINALPIHSLSVVGSGIMGGGIVWLFSNINKAVRLKARTYDSIAASFKPISAAYKSVIKRKRLTPKQVELKMGHISYTTDYNGFKNIDIVLEAVVESRETKQAVYNDLEEVVRDNCIIASNTSSLSISMLAEGMKNPERFIGMHFFNPVPRMPLVEVIAGEKTSDETIATVVKLARDAGKTAIVVGDCAGFLVNRILLPYINECARLYEEGGSIENIDKNIEDFGMPMGPFTLADEVGLDVGYKVSKVLEDAYGERMTVAPILQKMLDIKLLGKKNKRGFYIHEGKNQSVNPELKTFQFHNKTFIKAEIVDRAILMMVNEAARCLEEGIIKDASSLDMAMIMGTGFPPFRGGLLKYADSIGIEKVHLTLLHLEEKYGSRFAPAQLICTMAEKKEYFYKG